MITNPCRAPRGLCLSPALAEAGPRGLCPTCDGGLPRILDQLALDYADLAPMIGQAPAGGGQHVGGTKDLKTPLNIHIDELMGRIVHLVTWWEDEILKLLRQPLPDRAGLHPSWRISRAVTTLIDTRHVWLSMPERPYTWEHGRKAQLMDGIDAAIEAMSLHRTARATSDPQRRHTVHRHHGKCQACGWAEVLRRDDGDDIIWCANCHAEQSMDEYALYLNCFTPAARALGVQ